MTDDRDVDFIGIAVFAELAVFHKFRAEISFRKFSGTMEFVQRSEHILIVCTRIFGKLRSHIIFHQIAVQTTAAVDAETVIFEIEVSFFDPKT